MSKAITMSLAALAACALFACADGSDEGASTTSETSPNEPTALIDDNGGPAEGPRTTDQREDLESANGATARLSRSRRAACRCRPSASCSSSPRRCSS